MPNQKLETLLRSIVSCIGRKTTDPVLTWDESASCFHIQVNAQDQGRFIGKKGVVIWALKTIFWYAGLAQITRTVDIDLLEPKNPDGERRATPFKPNLQWDDKQVRNMIKEILETCFKETPRYTLENSKPAEAEVEIKLNPYLKTPCSDPDIAEAIKVIIHAAGMADGCAIKTEVAWE